MNTKNGRPIFVPVTSVFQTVLRENDCFSNRENIIIMMSQFDFLRLMVGTFGVIEDDAKDFAQTTLKF